MGLGTAVLLALLLFSGVAAGIALKWPSETRRGLEIARSVVSSASSDLGLAEDDETIASLRAAPAPQAVTTAPTVAPTPIAVRNPESAPRPQRVTTSRPVAVRRAATSEWADDGELHLFVVDDENHPVSGARVRVVSVMDSAATTPFDDYADEFGRVTVGPLGSGYVAITIEQESVRRTTRARIERGLRTDVTIARPTGAVVIGVVRDAHGHAVPGVAVRSAPRPRAPGQEGVVEDALIAISDQTGVYRMMDVPIGSHEVIVADGTRSDDGPQRHILDIAHRGTLTRDLTTAAGANTPLPPMQLPNGAGVVRSDSNSKTLSVARRVVARGPDADAGSKMRRGVRRQKTTAFPSRGGISAPATAPTAATDATSLRFRLTDERGEPFVGDVTIAMLPIDGAPNASTTNLTVYGRGMATFHSAVPGSYRISLRAAGHESATLLSDVAPGRNEIRAILARLPDPPAGYDLDGTIVDRTTGHAIKGCRVQVRGELDLFAFSTVDGRFSVASPDERPSGVWITHDDYESELVIAPKKGPVKVRMTPREK